MQMAKSIQSTNLSGRIIVSTLTTKKPFPSCLFRETAFYYMYNKAISLHHPTNVFPGRAHSTTPGYPATNVQTTPNGVVPQLTLGIITDKWFSPSTVMNSTGLPNIFNALYNWMLSPTGTFVSTVPCSNSNGVLIYPH